LCTCTFYKQRFLLTWVEYKHDSGLTSPPIRVNKVLVSICQKIIKILRHLFQPSLQINQKQDSS
jgi:hypothetical protein